MRYLGIILAITAISGLAPAEDFAVRAKPRGLERLTELALNVLPNDASFDAYEKTLLNCPLVDEDVVGRLASGPISFQVHSLSVVPSEGVVALDITGDIGGDLYVDMDRIFACYSGFSCTVGLQARPISIGVDVEISVSNGIVRIGEVSTRSSLRVEDFSFEVDDCLAGDAIESLYSFFDDWVLEKGQAWAHQYARDNLPGMLEELIYTSMPTSMNISDFTIEGALARLELNASTGLTLGGTANVTVMGEGPKGAPKIGNPEGESLPASFGPGDFAVAASDQLITDALYQAWRGGVFEMLLSKLATPSVSLSEVGLAQKLGLPEGTRVDVEISVAASPEVRFGRDNKASSITLPGLRALIHLIAPDGQSSTVELRADAEVDGSFGVDPVRGALTLQIKNLGIKGLKIIAGASEIRADPARLERFLNDVGTPMLAAKLAEMPLSPAFRPSTAIEAYTLVTRLDADRGWLRGGFDLYLPAADDNQAPETALVNVPDLIPAGMALLTLEAQDNKTPRELIRFSTSINGGPWSEPTFMSSLRLSLEDGKHAVQVAAVDLNGNRDQSPFTREIEVDGVLPELSVHSHPGAVVAEEVSASWTASDDRSGVSTQWQVRRVDSNGLLMEVVEQGTAGNESQVSLSHLDRGAVYILRIEALDEAGNTTSAEFGFAFEQGGGCSSSGGLGSLLSLAFCLLLMLALTRRTRLAVLGAVLVMASSSASAQSIGTYFSGPADGDGSSSFWNPAAMSQATGTRLDVGSGVSFVGAQFYSSELSATSNTAIPKPEPTVGMVSDAFGKKLRVGFTLGAPYAAGARWNNSDNAAQVTRYYASKAMNFYLNLTPSVSYELAPWISVGAGVSAYYGRLDAKFDKDMGSVLNQTLSANSSDAPFPYADPALAAPVELKSGGLGVGAVGGVLLTPLPTLRIGASIHSPVTVRASGSVEALYPESVVTFWANAAPFAELPEMNGAVNTDLKVPLTAFTAVSWTPMSSLELTMDYRFLNYSTIANTNVLISQATSPDLKDTALIRGYRDAHSIGGRIAWKPQSDRLVIAARGRWENNRVPERVTAPNNLDFEKIELGAAVRYRLTQRFVLTGQFTHFILPSHSVDESLFQPLTNPSLDPYNRPSPKGIYQASATGVAFMLSTYL